MKVGDVIMHDLNGTIHPIKHLILSIEPDYFLVKFFNYRNPYEGVYLLTRNKPIKKFYTDVFRQAEK